MENEVEKKNGTGVDVLSLFNEACNALAEEVNQKLFGGCRTWYWIGDQIGGLCDLGDEDFLTPDEMYILLSYKVTYEVYAEWRDWNVDYGSALHHVNLWSWIHGYDVIARLSSKEFEKNLREER